MAVLSYLQTGTHLRFCFLFTVQDFSKIDAGLMTLESIQIDLRSVLSGTLTLLRQSALDKDVSIADEVLPDVPAVLLGDPLRIQQVGTWRLE